MPTFRLLAAAALAAFAALALVPATIAQTPPPDGMRLYQANCAFCHGARGEGTDRGPDIREQGAAGVHYTVSTGRMPIEDPKEEIRRRPPQLSPEEIDALVDYARTLLGEPDVPSVDPRAGDPVLGGEIYLRNCAACHGAAATGGTLTSGLIAPGLQESTAEHIAEALLLGPGTMPRFVPPLRDDDVDAVAAYVRTLQGPPSPGGNPLGWVGPIAEGFVAWVVGAGVLLAIVRLLGSSSKRTEGEQ